MSVAVGQASVAVVPSFVGFQAQLKKGLSGSSGETAAAGVEAGKSFGRGFTEGSSKSSKSIAVPVDNGKMRASGEESGRHFGSGFLGSTKSVLEGLGAFAAFDFLKDAIRDGDQVNATMRVLEAHLKSTHDAAGLSAEGIKELSEKTGQLNGVNAGVELSTANMLLTFTNIRGAIYEKALPAVNDISASMKIGLPAAAKILGRALNDPANALGALSRAGVQFSAAQKEQIAQWTKTGQTAKAQELILDQVQLKMGGTAAAAVTPIQRLKVAWFNFSENVGQALIPMLNRLISVFTADVLPVLLRMARFVQNNTALVYAFIGAIGGLLISMKLIKLAQEAWNAATVAGTAVMNAYKGSVVAANVVTAFFRDICLATRIQLMALAVAQKASAAAQWLLNIALTANPVGLVILAIVALIAIIAAVIIKFHLWRDIVNGLSIAFRDTVNALKVAGTSLINFFVNDIGRPLVNLFTRTIPNAFQSGHDAIARIWNDVKNVVRAPVAFLVNTVYDNGIARIWNDTAGKVGLPKLPIEHFASGGRVPDGYPNDSYPAWLQSGEAVVPAHLAPAIAPFLADHGVPGFSGGWNPINIVKRAAHDIAHPTDAIKDIRNLAGDAAGAVLRGAYNTIVAPMLSGVGGAGDFSAILKAIPAHFIDMMVSTIKGHQDSSAAAIGGAIGKVASSAQLNAWITRGMQIAGVSGPLWQNGLTLIAQRESGGNPGVINTTDSNARAGTPSGGLMQFIKPTFDAYAMPGHTNWLDPVDQVVADAWARGYIRSRYGDITNVPGIRSVGHGGYVGYDNGGPLMPGATLAYNATGRAEGVLNPAGMDALTRLNSGKDIAGNTYISVKVGETDFNDLVDARIEHDNIESARLAEGSWSKL